MKKLVLIRLEKLADRTLGRLLVFNGNRELAQFFTLELPWKNNERRASCIPVGRYSVEPRNSPKYGAHLHVKEVPGRDMILFHSLNFPDQTEGCIGVGLRMADINADGKLDIVSSRAAMDLLTQFVTEPATLVVVDA